MKETRLIMGMPVTIEVLDKAIKKESLAQVFDYFTYIDNKFSTYKKTSEITLINEGKIAKKDFSQDMKIVFKLAQKTKGETQGFFDIERNGKIDPSGLVKGWAIFNAAKILKRMDLQNFFVDAGGDIQTSGKNREGNLWQIGIKNPFQEEEIIKVIYADNIGVATSGTYIRGQHIYNPKSNQPIDDIVSLTVVGPNIYEADRFATASFAMGKKGIDFIENLPGFEGYSIDKKGMATMTSNFERYTKEP